MWENLRRRSVKQQLSEIGKGSIEQKFEVCDKCRYRE